MATQPIDYPLFSARNASGLPLVGGQLFSYAAGTNTPQATYTDSTGITANPNPVVLNARGEAPVWLNSTLTYKFVLEDSLGNTIWTADNVPGGYAPVLPNPSGGYAILGNSNTFIVGSQQIEPATWPAGNPPNLNAQDWLALSGSVAMENAGMTFGSGDARMMVFAVNTDGKPTIWTGGLQMDLVAPTVLVSGVLNAVGGLQVNGQAVGQKTVNVIGATYNVQQSDSGNIIFAGNAVISCGALTAGSEITLCVSASDTVTLNTSGTTLNLANGSTSASCSTVAGRSTVKLTWVNSTSIYVSGGGVS